MRGCSVLLRRTYRWEEMFFGHIRSANIIKGCGGNNVGRREGDLEQGRDGARVQ